MEGPRRWLPHCTKLHAWPKEGKAHYVMLTFPSDAVPAASLDLAPNTGEVIRISKIDSARSDSFS